MAFAISYHVNKVVIDYDRIRRQEKKASGRAIRKGLAYIRTKAMRNVLRRRVAVSRPGSPPSVHTKDRRNSLKNILFDYDPVNQSGIVGPIKIHLSRNGYTAKRPIPSILETGGTIILHEVQIRDGVNGLRWVTRGRGNKMDSLPQRSRVITIKARPFMIEARDRVMDEGKVMLPWKDVLNE